MSKPDHLASLELQDSKNFRMAARHLPQPSPVQDPSMAIFLALELYRLISYSNDKTLLQTLSGFVYCHFWLA